MSIPANPFAFPAPDDDRPSDGYGMTLRDYFAAKALPAVIDKCAGDTGAHKTGVEAYFAMKAYAVADAMLAERSKA